MEPAANQLNNAYDTLSLGWLYSHIIPDQELKEKAFSECSIPENASNEDICKKGVMFCLWWKREKIDEKINAIIEKYKKSELCSFKTFIENLLLPGKFSFNEIKLKMFQGKYLEINLDDFKELPNLTFRSLQELELVSTRCLNKFSSTLTLPQLTKFCIRAVPIKDFPLEILKLTNLNSLSISCCKLKNIPLEIAKLTRLYSLNFHDNKLMSLPSTISKIQNLMYATLTCNSFIEIPEELFGCTVLQNLNLESNSLKNVTPQISILTSLEDLNLGRNQLSELPSEMSTLSFLQRLNLSNNYFTKLPITLVFENLTNLKLDHNKFVDFPVQIFNCKHIGNLSLNNNQIRNIPSSISNLQELTILNISSNEITEITSLIGLKNLKQLHVSLNPIRWDNDSLLLIDQCDNSIIQGLEYEGINLKAKRSESISFRNFLQKLSTLSKNIEENKLIPKLLLNDALVFLTELYYLYLSAPSTFALRYEEIQELKNCKFEILASFIFQKVSNPESTPILSAEDIFLFLSVINALFILDNSLLKNINVPEIYPFFNKIYKDFINKHDPEKFSHLLRESLILLSGLEKYHAVRFPKNLNGSKAHPLIELNILFEHIAFYKYFVSIMESTLLISNNSFNSRKKSIHNTLKKAMLTKQETPYEFQYSLFSLSSLRKTPKPAARISDNNGLIVFGLAEKSDFFESFESFAKDNLGFDPWICALCLETFMYCYNVIPQAEIGNATFNFLYQHCFTATHFLANHPLSPSLLRFFCDSMKKPFNRKKSFEAIALLLMANSQLKISEEWVPENIFEELLSYVQKTPLSGEKLAWCGALILMGMPLIGKKFIYGVMLPSPNAKANFFKTHWASMLALNDPLITPDVLDNFAIRLDLLYSDIINAAALEKKIRRSKALESLEIEFKGLRNSKSLMYDSITADQQQAFTNALAEAKKISVIFNQLRLDKDNSIDEQLKNLISKSFENIEFQTEGLFKIFEDFIEYHKRMQKELQLSLECEGFEEKIDKLIENNKGISSVCLNLFSGIKSKLSTFESSIRKDIHYQAFQFYNHKSVSTFEEWKVSFKNKTEKLKTVFDQHSSELIIIPRMHEGSISELIQDSTLIERYKIENYTINLEKELERNLYDYTIENHNLAENKKIQYLNIKVEKLNEKVQNLELQNSELKRKMEESPSKTAIRNDIPEEDFQISKLIQRDIKNLRRLQSIPSPKRWSNEWIQAWENLKKNLDEIQQLTAPSPKQFRNWERKEVQKLLGKVGFTRKGNLDGSHLEVKHPLFNFHTSLCFNTEKQAAIFLVKEYFGLIHDTLEAWSKEIIKRK